MDQAEALGFYNGHPEWSNLGQGEPEIGSLIGGTARIEQFSIEGNDDRYGPTNGIDVLRETISDYYNRLYRKDKSSKYTARNVSIAMGGRMALTRIFHILGAIKLGYKIPEYPAYKDIIQYQSDRITAICLPSKKENNHAILATELEQAIHKHGLNAFLFSNPCNPTGHVIQASELEAYIAISRRSDCALLIDEFYSHYIYENGKPAAAPISSAAYIQDVNQDPVLIIDGLTKSFRYPGWRLAWVLGPESVIEDLGRAASSIDGGPSVPIQKAALQLFEPTRLQIESKALRHTFSQKQNRMLAVLRKNGMLCSPDSLGTFYIWADISQLPSHLNHSLAFFKEALKHKVITVPGSLFDIRPDHARKTFEFNHFMRFSFGPDQENLDRGLERMSAFIQAQT